MSKNLRDYAEYGSLGISWVLTSLLAVYLAHKGGSWLDAKLGSDPAFTLIGLVLGILLSLLSLIQQLQRIERAWSREKTDKGDSDTNGESPRQRQAR